MLKSIRSYFRKRRERKLRERFAAIMVRNRLILDPEYLDEVVKYVVEGTPKRVGNNLPTYVPPPPPPPRKVL